MTERFLVQLLDNPSVTERVRVFATSGVGVVETNTIVTFALAAHAADTTDVHGIADTALLESKAGAQAKVDLHNTQTTNVHGISDTALLETQAGAAAKVAAHEADTTNVHGIPNTLALETGAGAAAKVEAHRLDTTDVHGIVDTTALETKTGAQTKANAALTSANAYTDAEVGELSTNTSAAITAHAVDTTAVHGIADTALLETKTGAQAKADAALGAANTYTDGRVNTLATNTTNAITAHAVDTTDVHGIADTALLATTANVNAALAAHAADTTDVHGIVDTADLTTTAEVAGAITIHATDTTNVHGIADTTALETQTGAQAKADAAEADAKAYADALAAGGADLGVIAAITSDVDDELLTFGETDPGETTDTDLRIAADGHITARNFTSRLRTDHFYGSNTNYPYNAGEPFFRVTDYGNIFGGRNQWVGENDDGSPRQINRDGTLSGQPPFQHDFIVDLHADTTYLGRRWVVGDTNDPADLIVQVAYGPTSVVSGGSLATPYVVGWNPIDVPVVSLGTDATRSAWGTRGEGSVHRQRSFDPADPFEHRQANNFTYAGLSFGAPHKVLSVVGERYTVAQAVTLNTTTPQDVVIEYYGFQSESKGRLIKAGGTVPFTRQAIGNTTVAGQPAKKFTGCLAASGTITLAPGDFIHAYYKFGDAENIRTHIDPEPAPASAGELPSWWTNAGVGAGIGRLTWRTLALAPGAVSGADMATMWSPSLASIGGEAAENIYTNSAAGRILFRTNPYGGTGNLIRATIEPLGQIKAVGGLSLDTSKDLSVGPNLNNPTPTLGRTGQYSYSNVTPLEYDKIIGAAMSITVTTTTPGSTTANEVQTFAISGGVAGDQYAIRFNGETSEPVAYDPDLTTVHNPTAAADFRAALESLPSVEPGDISVSRSVAGGVSTFTVTFGLTLVTSGSRFNIANTAPTTITNFGVDNDRAIDGQIFLFRSTNTNTTLKHNGTGTGKIWLSTTADRAMKTNETVLLVYDAGFGGFFEIAPGATTGGTAYQPLDSDLTAIAALATTTYGRAFLELANQAALVALLPAYQPADSDLTAIAALATTPYGRSLLTVADQAALVGLLPAYQPADADLTSIAALTTTTFGRSLLTVADAPTLRAMLGFENLPALEYDANIVSAATGALTLDVSLHSVHRVTMTGATTFTFTNPAPTGDLSEFLLQLQGAFTPTFPATVKWADSTPPTYASTSVYGFYTTNAGGTWYGVLLGKAYGL